MRNLGIILLLVAGLFRGLVLAQSQAATADLLGTVKDASDALLPGVEMTAPQHGDRVHPNWNFG